MYIYTGDQYQEVTGDKSLWEQRTKDRGWQLLDTLPEGTKYVTSQGKWATYTTPTQGYSNIPSGIKYPTGTGTTTNTGYAGLPTDLKYEPPAAPEPYEDPFKTHIYSLLEKYLAPKEFKYDPATDPSYKAYEGMYTRAGEEAFEDTIGRLSAMTGGRPSSWATSAASQAKNKYMEDLQNIIPVLEQQAYGRHRDAYEDIARQLAVLQDMSDTSYGRYRDTVSDYQEDRRFGRDVFESDRDFAYKVSRDQITDDQWRQEFDYNEQQDLIKNALLDRQISVDEARLLLQKAEIEDKKDMWQAEFDYKKEYDKVINSLKNRELTVQEASYNIELLDYMRKLAEGEQAKADAEAAKITPERLANYNQILQSLLSPDSDTGGDPQKALEFMAQKEKANPNTYTDLMGTQLRDQLMLDLQSAMQPQQTDLKMYRDRIDYMLKETIEQPLGEGEAPRYSQEEIKQYIYNLGLPLPERNSLLRYAGIPTPINEIRMALEGLSDQEKIKIILDNVKADILDSDEAEQLLKENNLPVGQKAVDMWW